jgi:cation diffusion facilitator CzcD-associated flavoprotein CzcO
MTQRHVQVAVIGAGPYGLSLSAHLSARGCAPAVFGRPMESWRFGAPPSMRLKSEGFASSLSDPKAEFTLKSFCRSEGLAYADIDLPTPIATFIAYGQAFQKRYAPQLDTRRAREIRKSPEGFEIELEDGTSLTASQCAIATGLMGFEHIPEPLRELSRAQLAHTAELHDYSVFSRRRVLVVGAGASATNAAAELLRHGAEVTLACRDELRFYPGGQKRSWKDAVLAPLSPIGPGWSKWAVSRFPQAFRALPEHMRVWIVDNTLGPAPGWFVREEIEGKIAVLAGRRILAARERGEDAEIDMIDREGARATHAFDHVIVGSGYRVDVDRLGFLSAELRAGLARVGGAPRLSRNFESSIPGLYFLGVSAAYHFGPAFRFVCGADYAARRVSRSIAARGRAAQVRDARAGFGAVGLNAPGRG